MAIITPALYFVYSRHGQLDRDAGLVLDMVTLTSTILGMVIFGHLADRLGRSKLYGIEVIMMLAAIGGAAFSSAGFIIHQGQGNEEGSLDIYAALFMFRFFLGLGIGAEVCLFLFSFSFFFFFLSLFFLFFLSRTNSSVPHVRRHRRRVLAHATSRRNVSRRLPRPIHRP